jgi:hypothetical protein
MKESDMRVDGNPLPNRVDVHRTAKGAPPTDAKSPSPGGLGDPKVVEHTADLEAARKRAASLFSPPAAPTGLRRTEDAPDGGGDSSDVEVQGDIAGALGSDAPTDGEVMDAFLGIQREQQRQEDDADQMRDAAGGSSRIGDARDGVDGSSGTGTDGSEGDGGSSDGEGGHSAAAAAVDAAASALREAAASKPERAN